MSFQKVNFKTQLDSDFGKICGISIELHRCPNHN